MNIAVLFLLLPSLCSTFKKSSRLPSFDEVEYTNTDGDDKEAADDKVTFLLDNYFCSLSQLQVKKFNLIFSSLKYICQSFIFSWVISLISV